MASKRSPNSTASRDPQRCLGARIAGRLGISVAACLITGSAVAQGAAPSPSEPDRREQAASPVPASPVAASPVAASPVAAPGEPAVRRSVVEDDNARIEELNVRGAVRSTRVQPKGLLKAEYEVLLMDAGRDITAGPSSARGAAGQSVWRVLSF